MDAEALPFRPRDRAAYFPGPGALVLADLHLGRGAEAAVDLPITGAVPDRLADLVERYSPASVVLAGDVLHSFAEVSRNAATAFEAVRAAVGDADIHVIAGNHDRQLDTLARIEDVLQLPDDTVVCHGHDPPGLSAPRYVVGHDHPAVVIEGKRRPCYLYGEGVYRGADVLCLPAFNPLATGTAVNRLGRGDLASPLLSDLRAFAPVVRDEAGDETFVFPPLSASGKYL